MSADGRALAVEADLVLDVAGEAVAVWADGDRVVVDAPTARAALALLRGTRTLPGSLPALGAELVAADLPVSVRVRRAEVAHLGPGATPGRLERAVGVDPAALSPVGVVLALGRALL